MLSPEVTHGVIYACADDGDCALVVTELLKGELLAIIEPLHHVEHRDALAAQTMISGNQLGLSGAVRNCRLLCAHSLEWEPGMRSNNDQEDARGGLLGQLA